MSREHYYECVFVFSKEGIWREYLNVVDCAALIFGPWTDCIFYIYLFFNERIIVSKNWPAPQPTSFNAPVFRSGYLTFARSIPPKIGAIFVEPSSQAITSYGSSIYSGFN